MREAVHLFFDLDGTLLDTQADVCAEMAATLGALKLDPDRFFATFRLGPPLFQALREVYPEIDPQRADRFIAEFRERYDTSDYPETHPYPGIDALLRRAAHRGKKLFIATNKRYRPTVRLLEKFGWTELFTEVFAVDRFAEGPMSKVEMLRHGSVTPQTAVMIGDSASDIFAGKEAGFSTVAVSWGYEPVEKLAEALPDLLVPNVAELASALGLEEISG